MFNLFERVRAARALANAINANRKPKTSDLIAAGLPADLADRFPRNR